MSSLCEARSARRSGAQGGVVGIAFFGAAVEAVHVRRVEFGALLKTLFQVGVGQVGHAEGDEVAVAIIERGLGAFAVVALVGDVGAFEGIAQCAVIDLSPAAHHVAFEDMQVGEIAAVQLLDVPGEVAGRVGVGHAVEGVFR